MQIGRSAASAGGAGGGAEGEDWEVERMTDREKVSKGLETSLSIGVCGKCVNECWYGDTIENCHNIIRDALALLKAQEPRVMTLEEVCKGLVWLDTYRTSEVEPVYILEMNKRGEIYYLVFGTGARPMLYDEDYNKEYRFWTSRPTDEQREATAWQ